MMTAMAVALPDFGPHRVIVSLPSADTDDLVAACEVLWQERLRTWALPVAQLDQLAALRALFGRRATFGVAGLTSATQAAPAIDAGAAFLAAPRAVPGLGAAGMVVPVILGGLTPSELMVAHELGATAVQVVPCEALEAAYAAALPKLVDGVPIIATGELTPESARNWLAGGAVGVWTTGLATRDRVADVDLDGLRAACRPWQL